MVMGQLGEDNSPLGQSAVQIFRGRTQPSDKRKPPAKRVGLYPSFNYITVIKYPDKMKLRGEKIYFSSVPGCHPLQQGSHDGRNLKQISHITPTGKAQEVTCTFFTFTQYRTRCLGNSAAYSGPGLLTSMNLHKTISYRYIQCRHSLIKTFFLGDR